MSILSKSLGLVFKLPDSLKLKMSGGKPVSIRGNTLDLDAQFLAINGSKGPKLDSMPPVKARATFKRMSSMLKGDLSKNVQVSPLQIPAGNHQIPARLYTPKQLNTTPPQHSGLVVYYHGGGNVIGDLDSYDALCGDLAEQLEVRVISVDYRLAPEHKFPAAATDAYHAYLWAREHAGTLSVDENNIIVAGDSAGGYLSAATSLQAIRNKEARPKAQILIYPMTDCSTQRESYQLFGENLVLTKDMMEYFIDHYINEEADKTDPLCSPLLADDEELKQMPPTLLTVAGFDPLHDEGQALYEKLNRLGVDIRLIEHKDLIHGFVTMTGALKRAREARDEILDVVKIYLN